jgi:Electron transfer DM13
MKFIIPVLALVLLAACKKSSTETVNDNFNPAGATLLYSGVFQGSGSYSVSGSAKIYNMGSANKLYLEGFSTSNGPDLKIYLSKDLGAGMFVDLGAIKSTNGNQLYDLPNLSDLPQYKYVLVWCKRFSALFGSAALN